jgi:hypothetical protein
MSDIYSYSPLWGVWNVKSLIGGGRHGKVYRVEGGEHGNTSVSAVRQLSVRDGLAPDLARADGFARESDGQARLRDVVNGILGDISFISKLPDNGRFLSVRQHKCFESDVGNGYEMFLRMNILPSVGALLRIERIGEAEIVGLGIDICDALEILELHGRAHGNIKNSNVFRDAEGRYKLGDYGLGRVTPDEVCNLPFASPEAVKFKDVSLKSDMYSLGLMLYRLLNGNKAPFVAAGDITLESAKAAQELRLSGAPLPMPSGFGGKLAEIALKACAFGPADRFTGVGEFKDALMSCKNTLFPGVRLGLEHMPGAPSLEMAEAESERAGVAESHMRDRESVALNAIEEVEKAKEEFERFWEKTSGFGTAGAGDKSVTTNHGGRTVGETGVGMAAEAVDAATESAKAAPSVEAPLDMTDGVSETSGTAPLEELQFEAAPWRSKEVAGRQTGMELVDGYRGSKTDFEKHSLGVVGTGGRGAYGKRGVKRSRVLVAGFLGLAIISASIAWNSGMFDYSGMDGQEIADVNIVEEKPPLSSGSAVGYSSMSAVRTAARADDASDASEGAAAATDVNGPVNIVLDKTLLNIRVGETDTLDARALMPDGSYATGVTWKSGDSSIVRINDGVVSGVSVGSAAVTATFGHLEAVCVVNVRRAKAVEAPSKIKDASAVQAAPVQAEPQAPPSPKRVVEGLDVDVKAVDLFVGQSKQLAVSVVFSGRGEEPDVVWTSNDPEVASVGTTGVLTARAQGIATITAACGGKSVSCTVYVN